MFYFIKYIYMSYFSSIVVEDGCTINFVEISTDGNLCICFGTDVDSEGNAWYSTDFNTSKTFTKFPTGTNYLSIQATSSATYTYVDTKYLIVYFALNNIGDVSTVNYLSLDENGTAELGYVTIAGTVSAQTAISVNPTGTEIAVACVDADSNNFVYVVQSETSTPLQFTNDENNTYAYDNAISSTIIGISTSYSHTLQGLLCTSDDELYCYYYNSSTSKITIVTINGYDHNVFMISNISNGEYFYMNKYVNLEKPSTIRPFQATFDNENTTVTQKSGFGTIDADNAYTNLRLYGESYYIFTTTNTGIIFSTDGTPLTSDDTLEFDWCAISNFENNQITLVACRSSEYVYYYSQTVCFLQNTKITILKNGQELEKPVEFLKNGDFVKINENEYRAVNFVGVQQININQNLDHLRVLPKNAVKEGFPYENLYLTSGHSLLFKDLTYANDFYNKEIYDDNIEDYCKIMSQHCNLCRNISSEEITDFITNEFVNVYHFSLEGDSPNSQYAIYSNGVRSESMGYEYALKKSNMRLLNPKI